MPLPHLRRVESAERLLEPGAFWASRLVLTAVELDLFSRLGGGERTLERLARELGLHPRGLGLFLDALAAVGLLRKEGRTYKNEPIAEERLVRGREAYAGHQLLLDGEDWGRWGRLEEALRLGRTPLGDDPLFADPGRLRKLLLGLHRDAREVAPALARRLPLGGRRRLLDLGGGAGSYSVAFCREHPELRCWLLDLPPALEVAREVVGASGVGERVQYVACDFCREPIPGRYDAVFASNILHARGEEENRALLRKVRGALEEGGLLVIREPMLAEDGTSPPWAAVFSVYLLLHTRAGRCYRAREVAGWLEEAGFAEVGELEPLEVLLARARGARDPKRRSEIMALLSEPQIREKLKTLAGWELAGKEIRKVYAFKSFMPAIQFVNKVAEIAEREQHHPDIAVNWNKVTLTLSTHSEGGVTEKDVNAAALFNKAA